MFSCSHQFCSFLIRSSLQESIESVHRAWKAPRAITEQCFRPMAGKWAKLHAVRDSVNFLGVLVFSFRSLQFAFPGNLGVKGHPLCAIKE